ncbi:hypothetical protein F0170_10085 [Pseudomonas sp. MAFF 730085]|uniref:Uncharacterized protein n=1 Tax=Pseudomonas kitaguniensis TaxID=2607908 RepID=A0A5N7JST7_9PSED|nr:hypothetical protein [Pseudomonas kitaguniensis]MPR01044.1 hypothetical protein [Pseudomonas kitaguniensis]
MLAKNVNDGAHILNERGILGFFARKLAAIWGTDSLSDSYPCPASRHRSTPATCTSLIPTRYAHG